MKVSSNQRQESPFAKVWKLFGGKEEAIVNFPKEIQFLKSSGIFFKAKLLHSNWIEYDLDNHPKILYQGSFERVDTLIKRHGFKLDNQKFLWDSKGNEWNYDTSKGLIQAPWIFDKSAPSYALKAEEVDILKKKYGQENKPCYVQLVTLHKEKPRWYLKNFDEQKPSHAAIRLIGYDGTVYSTGYELYRGREVLPYILTTQPAAPSRLDYEETAPFYEKYVTTFPITKQAFDETVDELDHLAKSGITRFHFRHRNCGYFAERVLKRVGVEMSCKTNLASIIRKVIAPKLSPLVDKVIRIAFFPIVFVFEKIYVIFHALLALSLGTNKKLKGMKEPQGDEKLDYWKPLWNFNGKLTWKNWLHPEQFDIYYTSTFRSIQKTHPNTKVFKYKPGSPQFNIV